MDATKDVKEALTALENCVQFDQPVTKEDIDIVLRSFKSNFELLKIYRSMAAGYKEEVQNVQV